MYEANHQLILGLVGAQARAEDIRQLVVKTTCAGAPVHVADIASVVDGTQPVYTTVTANGRNAVLLSFLRQPGSNTVAVADAVAAQVNELKKRLPSGVKLDVFYDQSQLVRDSITEAFTATPSSSVSCWHVSFLFLFLRDWTSSLIAGLVIPVTIAAAVGVLWLMGESFNLMTLGGLAAAIGLVIDDAIVVVENIVMHRDNRERTAGLCALPARRLTYRCSAQPPSTPVVVFLPLVSVSGVTDYISFARWQSP